MATPPLLPTQPVQSAHPPEPLSQLNPSLVRPPVVEDPKVRQATLREASREAGVQANIRQFHWVFKYQQAPIGPNAPVNPENTYNLFTCAIDVESARAVYIDAVSRWHGQHPALFDAMLAYVMATDPFESETAYPIVAGVSGAV